MTGTLLPVCVRVGIEQKNGKTVLAPRVDLLRDSAITWFSFIGEFRSSTWRNSWGLVRQLTWCRCMTHQSVRRALRGPTSCRPFRALLQVPYKNEAFYVSTVSCEWALMRRADWKLTVSNKEKLQRLFSWSNWLELCR